MANPFKKMRGLNDRDLNHALLHHTHVLRGMAKCLTRHIWYWRVQIAIDVAVVIHLWWRA